jgi:hypothetical protein
MGAYDELFGGDEKKPKSAYDDLFGSGSSPDLEPPPTDMDFSAEPMDVPKDNSLAGLLGQLLNGRAQQSYGEIEQGVAKSGVKFEQPRAAESYMGLMSPLGAAGKGLGGVAKSAANETIMGAAMAAFDEFQAGTPPEELLGALLKAGGVSGAADVALAGAGKVGKTAGDAFSWLGRKADNVKAGGTAASRKDLIEKFGIEGGPDMLGELLRKYSPSSLLKPKTSAGHLANIEGQLLDEGVHHRAITRQAGEEGADAAVPAAWSNAQADVLDAAVGAQQSGLAKGKAQAGREMEGLLYRMGDVDEPQMLEDLIRYKSQLQTEGARPGIANSIADDAVSQSSGRGGRILKDSVSDAVSAASPETAMRFDDSQRAFSELSGLEESLTPRAAADDSVGNVGSAMVSAGAASMIDPSMGILASLMSGTNNAVRQATGGVAHDLFSNVMHPAGAAARGIGTALDKAPTGMLTAQALGADNDRSRGHMAVAAVENALKTNPQQLGKYAERLQNAENKSTEITVLIDEDPEFRQLMRQLSAGAR